MSADDVRRRADNTFSALERVPGPWRVEAADDDCYDWVITDETTRIPVAYLSCPRDVAEFIATARKAEGGAS